MGKYYLDCKLKIAIYYENEIKKIKDFENSCIRNIYRARVEKIARAMNACFLNLGEQNAYLSLSDANEDIKEADEILVQIKKIPPDNKLAKLTMELSVDGKYLVYFPEEKFVKYSKKLKGDIKVKLNKLVLKNKYEGILFRTNSISASEEDVINEYKELKEIGDCLLKEKNLRPTPKLLYSNNDLDIFLRDNVEDEEVIVNDLETYNRFKDKYKMVFDKDFSILYEPAMLDSYKNLFKRKIELKSGASIIIDKAESLCPIDVNTNQNLGQTDFEDTIYKVNEEAAIEIVRQIILRNISGIIIIDFIDMKYFSNRKKLLKVLKREFSSDFSRTTIHGFTRLNLIEISRKNLGSRLKNKLQVGE